MQYRVLLFVLVVDFSFNYLLKMYLLTTKKYISLFLIDCSGKDFVIHALNPLCSLPTPMQLCGSEHYSYSALYSWSLLIFVAVESAE